MRRVCERVSGNENIRIADAPQVAVHVDAQSVMFDLGRPQIEMFHGRHTSGSVRHHRRRHRLFGAVLGEANGQSAGRRSNRVHLDARMDCNPDPFALLLDTRRYVRVHARQQPRQHLKDCHLATVPGVDMAELKGR